MHARPMFSQEMTVEEFKKYYWYRTELQEICKKCKLPFNGTKAELEHYIRSFLSGNIPVNAREESSKIRRTKHTPMEISLDTKLIEDGFKFNDKSRQFFANYFNVKKFSFTKEMASTLRTAEKNKDYNMTVADLINIYENKKTFRKAEQSPEEKTYQWNNFVKDFNNDESSKLFKDKMKVASILWSKVRDNPIPKEYNHSLLKKYMNDLKEFINFDFK